MEYRQKAVDNIKALERKIQRRGYPPEKERKLLSILGSIEYQIEEGYCPAEVVRLLKSAMQAWLHDIDDRNTKDADLEKCMDLVLKELAI